MARRLDDPYATVEDVRHFLETKGIAEPTLYEMSMAVHNSLDEIERFAANERRQRATLSGATA